MFTNENNLERMKPKLNESKQTHDNDFQCSMFGSYKTLNMLLNFVHIHISQDFHIQTEGDYLLTSQLETNISWLKMYHHHHQSSFDPVLSP